MERVIQAHNTGCVAASLASLANLPYFTALTILHPSHQPRQHFGSDDENTLAALKRLAFIGTIREPIPFQRLQTNALIFIKHPIYAPDVHCVLWSLEDQRILDPYPTKHRTPSRHLPLRSYQSSTVSLIEVRPTNDR